MKALRFLTVLLTAISLYSLQVVVSGPAYADTNETKVEEDEKSYGGFFSGTAKVGLDGKEKTGDESGGYNPAMVMLFAAVMAAPLYVMYCFDRIDTWIFVATSAIYVATEIANYNQFKEQSKQKMEAFNTGTLEGNQAQQQSLYEAAAQTEAAADAADRRAGAAQIAMMGYYAAGAIALVMSALDTWPPTCLGSGGCKQYACTGGMVGSVEPSLEEYYLNPAEYQQSIASNNYKDFENYAQNADNDLDFLVRNAELNRMKDGAVASMEIEMAKNIGAIFPEKAKEYSFVKTFKTIGYNIADLLLPRVQAKEGMGLFASLGIGAAVAALIAKKVILANATLRKFTRNGWVRGAGHMAFGAVATAVNTAASGEAKALRGRAAQYRELAAKLSVASTDTGNLNNIDTNYELGSTTPTNIGGANAVNKNGTCFTGSKGQLNEDAKCACKSGKKCKRPELPKMATMSTVSVPSAIKTSSDLLGSAGSSIFNGDLEGGLANSNAAGKNAARLKKLSLGIQKKANENFLASGAKPIDFNRLENSTRSKLIKAAVADIKNLSPDARAALGKRFPGVFGEGQEADKKTEIKLGDTKVKTRGGIGSLKGAKGSKKKDAMSGFTFDLEEGEEVAQIEPQPDMNIALDTSGDQVETDQDDIAGDRNKNIFSLITKRYFKTAYPRFFEESK